LALVTMLVWGLMAKPLVLGTLLLVLALVAGTMWALLKVTE
jgi:hypothetical protein